MPMDGAIQSRTRKIDADLWNEIQSFLSSGNTIPQAARRFALTAPAIRYRLRRPPIERVKPGRHDYRDDWEQDVEEGAVLKKTKNGRTWKLAAQLASWIYPRPAEEARFLLGIADRNGGRESMRKLISVTPDQRADLERLVALGQVSHGRVQRALEFRRQVLDAFDKLVVAWDAPAVVDGREVGASRRRESHTGTEAAVM